VLGWQSRGDDGEVGGGCGSDEDDDDEWLPSNS
jgi:hypothetical protein